MIRIVMVAHGADQAGVAAGRALRDAGHEVVHGGTQVLARRVAAVVEQEDADVVVVAFDAVGHSEDAGAVLEELRALLDSQDAGDVLLVGTRDAAQVVDEVAAALAAPPPDVPG